MEKIIIHYSSYKIKDLINKLDHTTNKKEVIIIVNLISFYKDDNNLITNYKGAIIQLKKLLIKLITENDKDIIYYGSDDEYDINELLEFKQLAFKLLDKFN